MWKVVAGALCALAFLHGQGAIDLLLPRVQHVVGVVVDTEGKPVTEVQVDHSNDRLHAYQTDSTGRFELDTRSPLLVLRKAGFYSELVRTRDATAPLRITLQKFDKQRVFRTCSNGGVYIGLDGGFQFSPASNIKASPKTRDIDYVARSYYIKTNARLKGIQHGSGPMWDFGTPSNQNVWQSIDYQEITYDWDGFRIIDARGQLPNGNRWRYLGKFGESASYSDVDDATAKILDRLLDSACLSPRPIR